MLYARLRHISELFQRKGLRNGFRAVRNALKIRMSRSFPQLREFLPFLPTSMDIEVVSVCNLRCPGCVHGHEDGQFFQPRAKFMRLEEFEKIMGEFGQVLQHINITPVGEAFLNPDIYDIIACAKKFGVCVSLDTNGQILDVQRTVTSGLDEITFSVDGFTQGTYEKYRRGGSLEKLLQNISSLHEAAIAANSTIKIFAKYCVNRYTENDVEAAREYFKQFHRVHFSAGYFVIPTPNWSFAKDEPFATTKELFNIWTPKSLTNYCMYTYDEESDLYKQVIYDYEFEDRCDSVDYRMFITSSGDAYACCRAIIFDTKPLYFGNVFSDGAKNVFNGDRARTFRALYKKQGGRYSLCTVCWRNRSKELRLREYDRDLVGKRGASISLKP